MEYARVTADVVFQRLRLWGTDDVDKIRGDVKGLNVIVTGGDSLVSCGIE